MKNRISTIFIFLTIFTFSENLLGQDSVKLKGKVSFFEADQIAYGAKIEIFEKNELIHKTYTDLESGTFGLTTTNKIDKIVFSFSHSYPTIIENINNLESGKLDLDNIKIYGIPSTFTRYATKEAERQDRKESRQEFRKLKKGIMIKLGDRSYKMRLKKKKGEYAFYIDFNDFQN